MTLHMLTDDDLQERINRCHAVIRYNRLTNAAYHRLLHRRDDLEQERAERHRMGYWRPTVGQWGVPVSDGGLGSPRP